MQVSYNIATVDCHHHSSVKRGAKRRGRRSTGVVIAIYNSLQNKRNTYSVEKTGQISTNCIWCLWMKWMLSVCVCMCVCVCVEATPVVCRTLNTSQTGKCEPTSISFAYFILYLFCLTLFCVRPICQWNISSRHTHTYKHITSPIRSVSGGQHYYHWFPDIY